MGTLEETSVADDSEDENTDTSDNTESLNEETTENDTESTEKVEPFVREPEVVEDIALFDNSITDPVNLPSEDDSSEITKE